MRMPLKFIFSALSLWVSLLPFSSCRQNTASNGLPNNNNPVTDTSGAAGVYQLVWSDEFNVNGAPDSTKWIYDVGGNGWGNNELEYYTNARPENARVVNGNLVIEARKEVYDSCQYTSARLLSKTKAQWTYGKFEIRAKLPSGTGTWPAIWMLSADQPLVWPDDGELDIMEEVGFNPDMIYGTAHNKMYNEPKAHKKGEIP
jgi:beta-glucanase (GH16 family)